MPDPALANPLTLDQTQLLEACRSVGLRTYQPSIRSSDLHTRYADPFRWFLTRVLGLGDPLQYSPALSRGSWLHKRFELFPEPDISAMRAYGDALTDHIQALTRLSNEHSIGPTHHHNAVEQARQDHAMALAWYEVAMNHPCLNNNTRSRS